eukprot:8404472-Alexandrium_andersonii.AAC.3
MTWAMRPASNSWRRTGSYQLKCYTDSNTEHVNCANGAMTQAACHAAALLTQLPLVMVTARMATNGFKSYESLRWL